MNDVQTIWYFGVVAFATVGGWVARGFWRGK